MKDISLRILDMECAACVARLDRALEKLPGVQRAAVNYTAASALITYDEGVTDLAAIAARVKRAGFRVPVEEQDLLPAEADAAKTAAAADALRQATTAFNESIVHIDAAALDAAKRAAVGLVESQYDRAAWATMREALAAAVATDMAHISQADVDALAARLNDAIAALSDARLDRGPLSDAIASAQALREGDYTAESWKAFAEALAAAQEECGRRSTTQGDLDKAVKALTQARDELERKQPGGGEEPGGGEDPEQPGSGGQPERPGGVKPGAGGNADTSKPGTAGTGALSKTGAQTLLLAVTACIMLAAGFSITRARSRRR